MSSNNGNHRTKQVIGVPTVYTPTAAAIKAIGEVISELQEAKFHTLSTCKSSRKRRKLSDHQQQEFDATSNLLDCLTVELLSHILCFVINDRATLFNLELTCNRFKGMLDHGSYLWEDLKINMLPGVSDPRRFVFELSFVNMVINKIDQNENVTDWRDWTICKDGNKNSMTDFDIECWKEFFHLAYNNQGQLGESDLQRAPELYGILQEQVPEMFGPGLASPPRVPQIRFNSDKTFKSHFFVNIDPWDSEGEETSTVFISMKRCSFEQPEVNNKRSAEPEAKLQMDQLILSDATRFKFSRCITVYSMRRKIDWDSIEHVYCYKAFETDPYDADDALGILIGKLTTGEYIKLIGNVLTEQYDTNCGCIWKASTLTHVMGVNEEEFL